jgi:hypothetical protein
MCMVSVDTEQKRVNAWRPLYRETQCLESNSCSVRESALKLILTVGGYIPSCAAANTETIRLLVLWGLTCSSAVVFVATATK